MTGPVPAPVAARVRPSSETWTVSTSPSRRRSTAARAPGACRAAAQAGVSELLLTHIPAWNDPEVCRAEAAAVWPGEVELACPDATYDV